MCISLACASLNGLQTRTVLSMLQVVAGLLRGDHDLYDAEGYVRQSSAGFVNVLPTESRLIQLRREAEEQVCVLQWMRAVVLDSIVNQVDYFSNPLIHQLAQSQADASRMVKMSQQVQRTIYDVHYEAREEDERQFNFAMDAFGRPIPPKPAAAKAPVAKPVAKKPEAPRRIPGSPEPDEDSGPSGPGSESPSQASTPLVSSHRGTKADVLGVSVISAPAKRSIPGELLSLGEFGGTVAVIVSICDAMELTQARRYRNGCTPFRLP